MVYDNTKSSPIWCGVVGWGGGRGGGCCGERQQHYAIQITGFFFIVSAALTNLFSAGLDCCTLLKRDMVGIRLL